MTAPLAGVRIADFTVHAAGPFCTHMLAQLGADRPEVAEDLTRLFNLLSGYAPRSKFRRLLVAPHGVRKGLLEQIAQEGAIQIFREVGGGMEEVVVGVVGLTVACPLGHTS